MTAGTDRQGRIALLCADPDARNGRVRHMADSLARAGYTVTLYTGPQPLREVAGGVTVVPCLPPDGASLADAALKDADLAGVDAVQVTGQRLLAWVAERLPEGGRLVYDAPGETMTKSPKGLAARSRALWSEVRESVGTWRNADRIDAVLCLSYAFGEYLQRELKLGQVPVVPIYAALPFVKQVTPKRPDILPEGRYGAVTAGVGFDTLEVVIRGIGRLRDVDLLVVNGRGEPGCCVQWARDAGMSGRLHLLEVPEAEELPALAGCDVGVFLSPDTSRLAYYDVPDGFFACMMAGLPVVASTLPALERIVSRNGTGLLAEPYDPEQLADNTLRLCKDLTERERIRHNVDLVREKRYCWEVQEARLLALYDQLLGG